MRSYPKERQIKLTTSPDPRIQEQQAINQKRLYRSPDIDRRETLLEAFGKRMATEEFRKSDPERTEGSGKSR